MTDHIDRYEQMDDKTFLEHAKYYRKFKNMTNQDHKDNIQYVTDRLNNLGYIFTEGCCNHFYIERKQDEVQQRQETTQEVIDHD